MLEYLEKFNNLPADVKQEISSGPVLLAIESLEEKYGVSLASFVMRVMVGELYYKNITANLIVEYDLDAAVAEELEKELKEKVFAGVLNYLEGGQAVRAKAAPEVTSPFFINKNVPAAPPKEAPKSASSSLPASQQAFQEPAVSSPKEGAKSGSNVVLPGPIVRRAPVSAAPAKNFLEDDEKDIAAMGKVTASFKPAIDGKNEVMLGEIIKEANISFASADLVKRFQEIISTYLRGIRTKVEVKENLLKDVASGGVKMEVAEADRVLAIAQKKLTAEEDRNSTGRSLVNARTTGEGTSFTFNKEEIERALEGRAEAKKGGMIDLGGRDADYDLAALSKKNPAIKAAGANEAVSLTGNIAPASPVASKIDLGKMSSQAVAPQKDEEKNILPVQQTPFGMAQGRPDADAKRTAAVSGNKRRMEDIKLAPKIMSPVDELAYMDLVNFRRLDQRPALRIAKIEEKISLLEKEGIDKKIEGIKAWRNNPVNKTYLSMGQESITEGKNINDIIKDREEQGLNYLTNEEFEAVMDLNDNLRF